MIYEFKWIEWNLEKIGKHHVTTLEAEFVVNNARRPFPKVVDDEKRLVWGRTEAGEYLQVIYLLESDDVVFVIHARPLTVKEKRQLRRRQR